MMVVPAALSYRFGEDVCVDVARMAVSRAGTAVPLEPKAFDVLRFLIEHRDRLVAKEELLDAVWRDTFVTPNVLTRVIAQLRKALGDDAQEARYIETVTRRGYRFIATVTVEPDATAPSGPIAPTVAAAAVAITPAIGANATITTSAEPRRRPRTRSATAAVAAGAFAAVIAVLAIAAWTQRARIADIDTTASADAHLVRAWLPSSRRITTRNGNEASPAVSPDGRAIAFSSDRTGALEIYVVGLAPGSQEIAITHDGGHGQNTEPAWSPDGQYLAFHSIARGGIWMVPATGGPTRQIAEVGSHPAWSPDGQSIAFSSSEGAIAGQGVIRIASRDGGNVHDVTRLGDPVGGHINPSWSTSGRYLSFAVNNGLAAKSIWIVPVAGGAPQCLVAMAGADNPLFSTGDRDLFFNGWEVGQNSNNRLFRVSLDPEHATAAGPVTEVLSLENGKFTGLSLSRDGTLAYGLGTTDANLWAIDLRPGSDRAAGIASDPIRLTDDAIRATRPEYSKDGRITFSQLGTGRPASVWVMREDAGGREPLLADNGPASFATWSADGQRVLVLRTPGNIEPTLWWIDVATRRATPLDVSGEGIRSPRVSPDGRDLAFWSIEPTGAMNVWLQAIDNAGGAARRRVTAGEAVGYPAWSPDGRWLAVEIKRGEQTHIGVVSKDGGPIEQITRAAGQSWPHSWSPDGDRIAYAAQRDGVWNVHVVSRRTRVTQALTHFTSPSGYVRYPAWSPRGDRIVFERETERSGIWTVQVR